jgi:EmrB/QacA subfamily drug resistance transporter
MTTQRNDTITAAPATAPVAGALAALSLSMLLATLGISIANVGLPALAQAFGASFQQAQWVVLAYLLAITVLVVSAGRLGDMIGRRRLLLTGLLLFALASVFCGLAPTLSVLIAARAMQGLGAAVLMALTLAFVGETVPTERIGSAMGLMGAMSAVGTALGPAFGGLLIAAFDWRAIFFIMAPLGMVAFLLAYRCLPADRRSTARRDFDVAGTLTLALTLAAYALAMTIGRGSFGALNLALLAAAVFGAGIFLRVEAATASPLIRFAMFRDLSLSIGLATSLLVAAVAIATLVVGPFYLSRALGLDAARVGLVLSMGLLVAALASAPAGRLVDRHGAERMVLLGLSAMAAGCFTLSMMPSAFGIAGYVAPLVVLTAGYALFQAANNTAVMKDVAEERRGVVSGMLNLSRNLGLITGTSALGAVFAVASGASDITLADPQAVAAGMRVTFAVAAVMMVLGLVITALRRLPVRQTN